MGLLQEITLLGELYMMGYFSVEEYYAQVDLAIASWYKGEL